MPNESKKKEMMKPPHRLQHEDWVRSRTQPTAKMIAKALRTLDRGRETPGAHDALPAGYRSPVSKGR